MFVKRKRREIKNRWNSNNLTLSVNFTDCGPIMKKWFKRLNHVDKSEIWTIHTLTSKSCSPISTDSNGATETIQDSIGCLFVLSQNLNTQKYWMCVVSLSWDNTHVLYLESETSILYHLRWLIPPKTSLIDKIFGRIEEKKKQRQCLFFICKFKSETMDFLTNQEKYWYRYQAQNKDNTCLVSRICCTVGSLATLAVVKSILKYKHEVLLSPNGNGIFSGAEVAAYQAHSVRLKITCQYVLSTFLCSWGILFRCMSLFGQRYVSLVF
jgi:hypothetical protein